MNIQGIHHIMLRVPDLERSKAFYGDVLGFDVQTPAEDLFFFSVGSTLIVLRPPLEGTPEGDRFSEQRVGVDHLAFAVETRQELENALVILQEAEIHTEGIERDPTLDRDYIAFRDPDNVQLEFYMI